MADFYDILYTSTKHSFLNVYNFIKWECTEIDWVQFNPSLLPNNSIIINKNLFGELGDFSMAL